MESFLGPWKKTHTCIYSGEISEDWEYKKENLISQITTSGSRQNNRARNRNERHTDWKEVKQSLFVDDILVYVENLESKTKLLIMNLARSQDVRSIYKKLLYFCVLAVNNYKLKF